MAKGPTFPPSPSFIKYQPACKPGSGGHRFLAEAMRDGHSSGTLFAQRLEQPTRTASLTSPCGVIAASSELSAMPSLFGFAPGGVYHAVPVAGDAVRSYRTFSPLLPPPRPSPASGGGRRKRKRFVLCGTFPGVAPAGRYPAPYVDGARTFLPGGLSALAGAAVRPTDAASHAGSGRNRQAASGADETLSRAQRWRGLRPGGARAARAASPASRRRRCRRLSPGGSDAGTR